MSAKLSIVLVNPRIASNVGSITRTALALGADLHLVAPFGFILDKKRLDRSSVGYWEKLNPTIYKDAADFWEKFPVSAKKGLYRPETGYFFATKYGKSNHTECSFPEHSVLIFGSEDAGVPEKFWDFKGLPSIHSCRIPTVEVRCLNLAVSVGILGFEAQRQQSEKGWKVDKRGEDQLPTETSVRHIG
jgi:tRNA (cytidine/uridine-2'-O-)-methyltransferase